MKKVVAFIMAVAMMLSIMSMNAFAASVIRLVPDENGKIEDGFYVDPNLKITKGSDGNKFSLNLKETPDENGRAHNPAYHTWVFPKSQLDETPVLHLYIDPSSKGVLLLLYCWQGGEVLTKFPYGQEFKSADVAGRHLKIDLKKGLTEPNQPKDKTMFNISLQYKYYDDSEIIGDAVINYMYLGNENDPPPTGNTSSGISNSSSKTSNNSASVSSRSASSSNQSATQESSAVEQSEISDTEESTVLSSTVSDSLASSEKPTDVGGDENGFPWLPVIVVAVIILLAGGGAVAYLLIRKKTDVGQ